MYVVAATLATVLHKSGWPPVDVPPGGIEIVSELNDPQDEKGIRTVAKQSEEVTVLMNSALCRNAVPIPEGI